MWKWNFIKTFITASACLQHLSSVESYLNRTPNFKKLTKLQLDSKYEKQAVDQEQIDVRTEEILIEAYTKLAKRFFEIDMKTKKSISKILELYKRERVDSSSFHGVNGYGHGDIGREQLDSIIASLMGAESALVRLQLFSGTHAISTALFACLRPGDEMLCISGHPYDTLEEVVGLRPGSQTGTLSGSLKDWGISYSELDLVYSTVDGSVQFDLEAIDKFLALNMNVKLIHIQR